MTKLKTEERIGTFRFQSLTFGIGSPNNIEKKVLERNIIWKIMSYSLTLARSVVLLPVWHTGLLYVDDCFLRDRFMQKKFSDNDNGKHNRALGRAGNSLFAPLFPSHSKKERWGRISSLSKEWCKQFALYERVTGEIRSF